SVASIRYLRAGPPLPASSLPACSTAWRVGVPAPVGAAPAMAAEMAEAVAAAGTIRSGAVRQAWASDEGNSDRPHATSLRRASTLVIDDVRSVHLLPVGVASRMLFERSSTSTISPEARAG